MKRFISCCVVSCFCLGLFVGCGDETKATKTEKVSTPGGTTTKQTEVKEKTTGSNPPSTTKP